MTLSCLSCCANPRTQRCLMVLVLVALGLVALSSIMSPSLITTLSYRIPLPERTLLGESDRGQSRLVMWVVEGQGGRDCAVIDAGNGITAGTVDLVEGVTRQGGVSTVYIVGDSRDIHGRARLVNRLTGESSPREVAVALDSQYRFLRGMGQHCRNLAYLPGSIQLDEKMRSTLRNNLAAVSETSMYYSSAIIYRGGQQRLPQLQDTDLLKATPQLLGSYMHIIPTQYLSVITPVNFAFYTRYIFHQIVVLPLLVLYQSSGTLKPLPTVTHEVGSRVHQAKQYALEQLVPLRGQKSLCFVSYPADPFMIDYGQLQGYMASVARQVGLTSFSNTVVVYLPYKFQASSQLAEAAAAMLTLWKQNPQLIVRLRITAQKAVSTHGAYESAFTYCPRRSIMVSSRHNIRFQLEFADYLLGEVSEKYHYYFAPFLNHEGTVVDFRFTQAELKKFNRKNDLKRSTMFYWEQFRQMQVMKVEAMRSVLFWMLKSAEMDFYESEAAFITYLMQCYLLEFKHLQKVLASAGSRPQTPTESAQTRQISKYAVYYPIRTHRLMPYAYSCLLNPAYRRNAPYINNYFIHQIWLSKDKPSEVRKALHQSIIDANPNFQVKLWGKVNITKQEVPLMYHLVTNVMESTKYASINMAALAVDLLRYELLYRYGGIYIDFKFEGLKPLDEFLKYELFFIDCDIDISRLGTPKPMGNGVMGAVPNNHQLHVMLTELIDERRTNEHYSLSRVTGSFVLRKTVNNYQFFAKVGFGFHLVLPEPYSKLVNRCGEYEKERKFDSDQRVFQIDTLLKGQPVKVKVGLPCKEYPEAYIIDYVPLSRTWLKGMAQQKN